MSEYQQYIESAKRDFRDMTKEANNLEASINDLIEVIHEQEEKIEKLEAALEEALEARA